MSTDNKQIDLKTDISADDFPTVLINMIHYYVLEKQITEFIIKHCY